MEYGIRYGKRKLARPTVSDSPKLARAMSIDVLFCS